MNNKNPEIVIQNVHFGTIKNVSFSKDGRYLAIVPFEGSIEFRDIMGRLVSKNLFFNGSVGGFQWHPLTSQFLAASYNGKVMLSDLQGEVHMSLDHGGYLNGVMMRSDGSALITEGGGAVRLWDDRGTLNASVAEGDDSIRRAGFLHDGKVFLLKGEDEMRILDPDRKNDRIVKFPPGWIESFDVDRDGVVLLAMSGGLFCAGKNDAAFSLLHRSEAGVYCGKLSPDGSMIAVAESDGAFFLLDRHGEVVREFERHPNTILDLSWSPDGHRIATGCADCAVRLFNADGGKVWALHDNTRFSGFRFESDGTFKHFVQQDDLYDSLGIPADVREFLLRHATILPVGSVNAIGIMPDGGVIAAWDDCVQVYGYDGIPGIRMKTGGEHINHAAVSTDGQLITGGCSSGALFFWRSDGEMVCEDTTSPLPVKNIAWNAVKRVWAVSRIKPERVIDLFDETGLFLRTIAGRGNEVSAIAFSDDGNYIVSGTCDGEIIICDVSGNNLCVARDPDGFPLNAVAMGADGRVFTGSGNGSVRIWEKEHCRKTIMLKNQDNAHVHGIYVLSDGSFVCGYVVLTDDEIKILVTVRDKNGTLLEKTTLKGQSYGIDLLLGVNEKLRTIAAAMINRITIIGFNGEMKGVIKTADARITVMEMNTAEDASCIVSGFEDGTLELRRFNGDVIACVELEGGAVNAVAISGDRVLAAMSDASVCVLNGEGELVSSFNAPCNICSIALCPGADSVALGHNDGSIGIFSIAGELIRTIPAVKESYDPVRIVFSADGERMAAAYAQGDIRVYDNRGSRLCSLYGYSVMRNIFLFYHLNSLLIFGNVDSSIEVADVHRGETVVTIVPAGGGYLAYTPQGEYDYSAPELEELVAFSDGEQVLPAEVGAGLRVPGLLRRVLGH